jgi:tRNA (cytosine38-C5)-methyltransferase
MPCEILEEARAQLWMLAPPCQPYTRRGLQQDADDGRARSFMELISWIPNLKV